MARKIDEARKDVPAYVEPRDCFVWHMNTREGYAAIPGTPCAHYVAHQIGMVGGSRSDAVCKESYLLRVEDLVARLGEPIDAATVQAGDVWAHLKKSGQRSSRGKEPASHCGVVSKVVRDASKGPTITIKHCSSGQRKVAENDWQRYFHAGGSFYRLPGRERSAEAHANLQRLVKGFDYRAPFRGRV